MTDRIDDAKKLRAELMNGEGYLTAVKWKYGQVLASIHAEAKKKGKGAWQKALAEIGENRKRADEIIKIANLFTSAEEACKYPVRRALKLIRKGAKGKDADSAEADNGSFRPRPFFRGCNSPDPKKNDIPTPPGLCQFLYDVIWPHFPAKVILDPCAGDGNLTIPWQKKVKKIVSFEIKHGKDFFQCDHKLDEVGLVLCNPPFNGNPDSKVLFPWKFLGHILELVPENTPIVLFVPFGFLLNARTKTGKYAGRENRYAWLRDECPQITSFVPLPLDVFAQAGGDRTLVHSQILFFNMPRLEPCYFVPHKYLFPSSSMRDSEPASTVLNSATPLCRVECKSS